MNYNRERRDYNLRVNSISLSVKDEEYLVLGVTIILHNDIHKLYNKVTVTRESIIIVKELRKGRRKKVFI